jgi:hypothetical protein
MAETLLLHRHNDPLRVLSENIFCAPPPGGLSSTQLCALHEFLHEVLAAGYKLYQKVPPDAAAAVIRDKFGKMAGALPPPPSS